MRRLVDRSRTGGRRAGRQNHRCWSAGEDRGNGRQLHRTIFASTVAMNLSGHLAAICIGAIAFAGPLRDQLRREMPKPPRRLDKGGREAPAYRLQKWVGKLAGKERTERRKKWEEP